MACVELGILPIDQPPPVMPLAGFSLHDDDIVFIETLTGEQRLDDPSEVAAYLRMFELPCDATTTGSDAVRLIQRVAADLRQENPEGTRP